MLEDSRVIDSLYRISSLAAQTEDPREALTLILAEVVRVFQGSCALIALMNPDTNQLEVEVSHGMDDGVGDLGLEFGQGIVGRVALSGQSLLVDDIQANPYYIPVNPNARAMMAVPMLVEGMVVGVVSVDSEKPGAFGGDDLKLLTLLTRDATRVVSRLWLFNQLKDKADQLESIITIGRQLVSTRELQSVLDSIAAEARKLMGCRVCAIFLLDDDRESLRLCSLAGVEGAISNYEENLRVEDSSVGVAISRKKQVAVLNLPQTEEHHFVDLIQREGLVSLLSTPILFEDEAIGVLNVYTDKLHRFNNDERRVFSTLASLGAVAIENSRLYSRVFSSEESLRNSERLTTLGLLAAEIAHEIRNPLTVIKLLFDSLNLEFSLNDPRHEDTTIIREKLNQLEEIVDRVLSFGKSRTELHSHCCLGRLVEETLLLVRLKLEQCKVQLVYDAPKMALIVNVHKGQIQQVLLNLILNAVKAMPHGGEIRLSLQRVAVPGQHPRIELTLADTGLGIPEGIRDRIFDSLLMERKGGTGLGLSISKQILKAHHGQIELLSSGPGGSSFRFWLPEASF